MPIAMIEYPMLITAASSETKLSLWKLGNCTSKRSEGSETNRLNTLENACATAASRLRDCVELLCRTRDDQFEGLESPGKVA